MVQDKVSQLEQDYKHNAEAEALFFKDKFGKPAFRLEVPDLDLEFTDGFYIGSDPKGRFYYNDDFNKINMKSEPKARYTVETTYYNRKVYANIKLYYPDSKAGSAPYAEFFASDPQNLTAGSGLVGLTDRTGHWKRQKYSRNSATIEKAANSARVSIKSKVIHKKAEFDANSNSFNHLKDRLKVHGTLYLKDTEAINSAHYARWYSDHVVFYDNDYSGKEFAGFFFPLEYKEEPDETGLGSERDKIFSGVHWSHF